MGILWHDQALCDPQGHLWEGHPILEASRLTPLMVHLFLSLDCRFCRAAKLLAPMPDATEMLKKLRPTPRCVAGPRGDLTPKEDTESADSAVGGPTLPENGPEQLKRTSADSVDVIIHILAAGHTPATVPVVPLPDVDVDLEKQITYGVPPARRSSAPLYRENVHDHFV